MTTFEDVQYFYQKGWAEKEHVAMYVEFGVITPEQYEIITGDPYVA